MEGINAKLQLLINLEKSLSEPTILSIHKEPKDTCIRKWDEILESLNNDKDIVTRLFDYSTWHNYLQIAVEGKKLYHQIEEKTLNWELLKQFIIYFSRCPILSGVKIDPSSPDGLFLISNFLMLTEASVGKETAKSILNGNPERFRKLAEVWYDLDTCRRNKELWGVYLSNNIFPESKPFILTYLTKCGNTYFCPYRRARYERDADIQDRLKLMAKNNPI